MLRKNLHLKGLIVDSLHKNIAKTHLSPQEKSGKQRERAGATRQGHNSRHGGKKGRSRTVKKDVSRKEKKKKNAGARKNSFEKLEKTCQRHEMTFIRVCVQRGRPKQKRGGRRDSSLPGSPQRRGSFRDSFGAATNRRKKKIAEKKTVKQ